MPGLEKVCGMLNLPQPTTAVNFGKINNVLPDTAKVVAGISMDNGVDSVIKFECIGH